MLRTEQRYFFVTKINLSKNITEKFCMKRKVKSTRLKINTVHVVLRSGGVIARYIGVNPATQSVYLFIYFYLFISNIYKMRVIKVAQITLPANHLRRHGSCTQISSAHSKPYSKRKEENTYIICLLKRDRIGVTPLRNTGNHHRSL